MRLDRFRLGVFAVCACLIVVGTVGFLATAPGCATGGDTQATTAQQVVATGVLIGLDVDAIKQSPTEANREILRTHVDRAVKLIGLDTTFGGALQAMLDNYVKTGSFGELSWRDAARMMLEWVSNPQPNTAPVGAPALVKSKT